MKEPIKHASHQQASQLLHNKLIVVVGDSIQRAVYKDFVLLLQKEKYLTTKQLKTKGEMSFEQDRLVEGGCLNQMHNGSDYKEVRQFQSANHLVRFYFVTRIYSQYMKSILEDFRSGLKPDVVIVNSCVWDISRYSSSWIDDYKENLDRFFKDLRDIVPGETLVIWNLTMPLGEKIKGGFLVREIEHKAPHLRYDVIEANFYSGTLADAYGMDVLDLHFQFRFSLQHRTKDGVHWNALAHRRITSLLLQHIAQAWGVIWPSTLTSDEHTEATDQQPALDSAPKPKERRPPKRNYTGYGSFPVGYIDFENCPWPQQHRRKAAETSRRRVPMQPLLPVRIHRHEYRQDARDFNYRPYHQPYLEHHPYVMRSRHNRHHYAPYTNHRNTQYQHYGYYY